MDRMFIIFLLSFALLYPCISSAQDAVPPENPEPAPVELEPAKLRTGIERSHSPMDGFSICNAIVNIASILYETTRYTTKDKPFKPYSQQSTKLLEELSRLASSGNFASMERATTKIRADRGRSRSAKKGRTGSSWMSAV